MFKVSERQAFELTKRCEAIKNISDPVIFTRIETLVQQSIIAQQLSDDEVNQLYKLLNSVVDFNNHKVKTKRELQNEWDSEIQQRHLEENEHQVKDIRNHLFLCNRINQQTVETMRRYVQLITSSEVKSLFPQKY